MFRVSDARPQDVTAIEDIRQKSWLKTYPDRRCGLTVADIKKQFNPQLRLSRIAQGERIINTRPARHTYVAKDYGAVVGFISCRWRYRRWEISSLYIDPAYERQGIGSRLMRRALRYIGLRKIYVSVAIYNIQAINFYKKFGFHATGRTGEKQLASGKALVTAEMVKSTSSQSYS
jgi:ribosomal protein S18 acetylase RimI-like enzyme